MGPLSPLSFGKIDRRRFLAAGLMSAAGLALYSGEVARHWVELIERDVQLAGLPEALHGLRIAQISDIHFEEYTEAFFLRHVVHRINRLKPDVVVLTGDFISIGPLGKPFAAEAIWKCAQVLAELDCPQVFAVLGNHDVDVDPGEVTRALSSQGVTVLNNSHAPIERGNHRLWMAGMVDIADCKPRPELAVPEAIRQQPEEPVILLCHSPDYADQLLQKPVGQAIGLMLSGHTHGGQIRLPLFGPLVTPIHGRKYIHGLFHLGALQLYVNRGIGTVGVPFRFACPPEITVLTLKKHVPEPST